MLAAFDAGTYALLPLLVGVQNIVRPCCSATVWVASDYTKCGIVTNMQAVHGATTRLLIIDRAAELLCTPCCGVSPSCPRARLLVYKLTPLEHKCKADLSDTLVRLLPHAAS